VNGKVVSSTSVIVHWLAGRDTTFDGFLDEPPDIVRVPVEPRRDTDPGRNSPDLHRAEARRGLEGDVHRHGHQRSRAGRRRDEQGSDGADQPVKGCPPGTGRVAGNTLGPARLGMTRREAHHTFSRSKTRGLDYEEFFCLTPIGVRVGYASPKLLRTLARGEQNRLRGRVVWISTSNPIYAVGGVRPGATLRAAELMLPSGNLFHVGLNYWYIARWRSVTAILKVRKGIVEEVGIAVRAVTKTRTAQSVFVTSFS
jgi:hypothetical protein